MDERSLFLAVLELPTQESRDTWLRENCRDDETLRARIVALLAAHEAGTSQLSKSPLGNCLLPTQVFNGDTSRIVQSGFAFGPPTVSTYLTGLLQPSDSPDSIGRLGHYEIRAQLGQGGMGVVLKGFDPKLNRAVAIKILAPQLAANEESRRRFLREAQAAAAVVHPHVVTIHVIDDGEPPYLVMELVEGESLQEKLDRDGPLPFTEIARIGGQVAAGLAAAHAKGLVHRDIKPANILMEQSTGRVKLTDFGLARAADDVTLTSAGLIVGTPLYMSPEQSQGQNIDQRSDLFSLGAVLYALATGKSPFYADSSIGVIRQVCDHEPPPLDQLHSQCPRWLGAAVEKLMEKRAANRFASASEVAQVFAEAQTNAGLFPASAVWLKRKPPVQIQERIRFAAVALLVSAVCILGIVLGWNSLFSDPEQEPAQPPANESPPPVAQAPFDAPTAKSLQQQWADHLGIKVEFTNKVGMKFRLIPAGEYEFGMTPKQYEEVQASNPPAWAVGLPREAEQRQVKIEQPFYLAVHEVTVGDFRRFADAEKYVTHVERPEVGGGRTSADTSKPPERDPDNHWRTRATREDVPVGLLVLADQQAYLKWLDQQTGCTNVLPTEEQWEYACRAGTTDHWCDRSSPTEAEELGWFERDDKPAELHAVGQKLPNAFGLYDMLGNAGERTWALGGNRHTVERGGSASVPVWLCRSTSHIWMQPDTEWHTSGFRVAIVGDLQKIPEAAADRQSSNPAKKPPLANAPFAANEAAAHQQRWADYLGVPVEFENPIGMHFRLIPPGKFTMGSSEAEVEKELVTAGQWQKNAVKSEMPQREVTIAEPFYLGKFEVTRGQFERFVNEEKYKSVGETNGIGGKHYVENEWAFSTEFTWRWKAEESTSEHPVRLVAAEDMNAFCSWLSKYDGGGYQFPTEEQWEYACRAGTTTPRYSTAPFETLAVCNHTLQAVGGKPANPFGLYDMLGNVNEVTYNQGKEERRHTARGGQYFKPGAATECRSAYRCNAHTDGWQGTSNEGYRLVLMGDLKRVVAAAERRKTAATK